MICQVYVNNNSIAVINPLVCMIERIFVSCGINDFKKHYGSYVKDGFSFTYRGHVIKCSLHDYNIKMWMYHYLSKTSETYEYDLRDPESLNDINQDVNMAIKGWSIGR